MDTETKHNLETDEAFDVRYHARNNPAAARRDRWNPCVLCGWSETMAIHDAGNIGTIKGWAHPYEPRLSRREVCNTVTT